MAIDGQVCFHRWPFADPVKPRWCITGPVGTLGSTNENWLCARLLSMAVLIYPVVCVHSCCLLRTQHQQHTLHNYTLFSIQHPCYFMENKAHFVPLIYPRKVQYVLVKPLQAVLYMK